MKSEATMKKLYIKQNNLTELIPLIIIFLASCEFLYSKTTGERTSIALIVLTLVGFVIALIKNEKYRKHDLYKIVVMLWVLVWTNNIQSVRYFLTLGMAFYWSRQKLNDIDRLIRVLIYLGTALSAFQIASGQIRVYGFYASSPTQYACTLFIFEAYLLIVMCNKGAIKKNIISTVLCLINIYFTETRSALLAAVLLFAIYIIAILVNESKISSPRQIVGLIVIIMAVVLALNYQSIIDLVMNRFHRTNMDASNLTRNYLYNRIFSMFREEPYTLLIGKKGGYIHTLFNTGGAYLPVHQDYLMVLAEYGLIGVLGVYFSFLKKHSMKIYFLIVFSVCSFHNIVLNPVAILFMVITMTSLEKMNCKLYPVKKMNHKKVSGISFAQSYGGIE